MSLSSTKRMRIVSQVTTARSRAASFDLPLVRPRKTAVSHSGHRDLGQIDRLELGGCRSSAAPRERPSCGRLAEPERSLIADVQRWPAALQLRTLAQPQGCDKWASILAPVCWRRFLGDWPTACHL